MAGRWPLGMVWVELGTHEHGREAEGLGSLGFGPIFVFFLSCFANSRLKASDFSRQQGYSMIKLSSSIRSLPPT